MSPFRYMGLQQGTAVMLLFTILNFSLNTINMSANCRYFQTEQEIESFSELLLEEVLNIEGAITDTPENDQESSVTSILLYFSNSGNPLLHCTIQNFTIPCTRFKGSYSSFTSERQTPPPQLA